MLELNVSVLTTREFRVLSLADPKGYYRETERDELLGIIDKLKTEQASCTRPEKKLLKLWNSVEIGILAPRGETLSGPLFNRGKIRVEGRVAGRVVSDDEVIIESGGEAFGDVTAPLVVCRGFVRGTVRCAKRLEVASSARMEGDLIAPNLFLQKGARVDGQCNIVRPEQAKKRVWLRWSDRFKFKRVG
ncbi:MAG: polymer-forming cytoskeletal protein [Candidatus Nitrohelix vancouverensis]|uniref:Polymer-forming cytoskeletal protein n=1 Tax=Candidatus Nitrohelix vancouverensis TaxID=2705534 RepID=A0A7T0C120_9BACT|nr:MAG: polymer-forming cytoskeletal protein [Candidatus Nitrohelix vancouverensis]